MVLIWGSGNGIGGVGLFILHLPNSLNCYYEHILLRMKLRQETKTKTQEASFNSVPLELFRP